MSDVHTPDPAALQTDKKRPAGPVMPVRVTELQDVPGYEGFQVRIRTNYFKGHDMTLAVGKDAAIADALAQIVVAHNGWLREDETPYPAANTPACWDGPDAVPTELTATVIQMVRQSVRALPNSVAARKPR